jgi:hypothetical protein
MDDRGTETFLRCLRERRTVTLRFRGTDGRARTRRCAPLDLGPVRRARDDGPRYQFWDYDGCGGPHWLSVRPAQIEAIGEDGGSFDPASIVDWDLAASPWSVPRDWDERS